jgi:hypothetical protein
MKFRSATRTFRSDAYALQVFLPNFFFHVATAHNILRHNGLKIGKSDYLGTFDTVDSPRVMLDAADRWRRSGRVSSQGYPMWNRRRTRPGLDPEIEEHVFIKMTTYTRNPRARPTTSAGGRFAAVPETEVAGRTAP